MGSMEALKLRLCCQQMGLLHVKSSMSSNEALRTIMIERQVPGASTEASGSVVEPPSPAASQASPEAGATQPAAVPLAGGGAARTAGGRSRAGAGAGRRGARHRVARRVAPGGAPAPAHGALGGVGGRGLGAQRVPGRVPVGHHAPPVRGGAQVLPPDPAVRAAQRHRARLLPAAAAQAAPPRPRRRVGQFELGGELGTRDAGAGARGQRGRLGGLAVLARAGLGAERGARRRPRAGPRAPRPVGELPLRHGRQRKRTRAVAARAARRPGERQRRRRRQRRAAPQRSPKGGSGVDGSAAETARAVHLLHQVSPVRLAGALDPAAVLVLCGV